MAFSTNPIKWLQVLVWRISTLRARHPRFHVPVFVWGLRLKNVKCCGHHVDLIDCVRMGLCLCTCSLSLSHCVMPSSLSVFASRYWATWSASGWGVRRPHSTITKQQMGTGELYFSPDIAALNFSFSLKTDDEIWFNLWSPCGVSNLFRIWAVLDSALWTMVRSTVCLLIAFNFVKF